MYLKRGAVVELLAGYVGRYEEYPEEKQQEVLSVMLIYFQSTFLSEHNYQEANRELLSLSGIFTRP